MKKLLLGVPVLVLALVFAGAGDARKKPTAKDYTLEEAKQLFNAPSNFPTSATATAVQVPATREALAALPGDGGSTDVGGGGTAVCFAITLRAGEGTWPYQTNIEEFRYWCAYWWGGAQYYRSSVVTGDVTVCEWGNQQHILTGGGNGHTWTRVRSSAFFTCPTIISWAGFPLTRDVWQQWSCNTMGQCAREGTNYAYP